MIYDCFTFFNELEILEIRLHELDPWVDRFVLVESTETFSGNKKPLYFTENKHRYSSFLPKIIHLVSPAVKNPKDHWERQKFQRDYALSVLSDCVDDDLILSGDADEIPRGVDFTQVQETVGAANEKKQWMTPLIHHNYFFYLNLRRPGGWPGMVMVTRKNLRSTFNDSLQKARFHRRHGRPSKNAGWHFANMGGEEAVRLKMKSSGHFGSKLVQKMLITEGALYNRMEVDRAVKGKKLVIEPITNHPVWLKNNIERFKHLLTKEKAEMGIKQYSKIQRRQAYVDREKWATALLNEIAPTGKQVGVEVGLWKGDFAQSMLLKNKRLHWFGVDPYFPYGKKKRKQPEWDGIYKRVMKKLSVFGNRFTSIRKPSAEGVEFVPDNVDFVFIDGSHDYEYVLKDLILYEPKVRPGGIMGGHDYHSKGVKDAVDKYAKAHKRKLIVDRSFDRCPVFWWAMP